MEKKKITCTHEDHGEDGLPFYMDKNVALAYQAADKSFNCPDGHQRAWRDVTISSARKELKRYVEQEDEVEERIKPYQKDVREQRRKRKKMEEVLKNHIAEPGIIEAAPRRYYWKCSCGSVSTAAQNTENQAQNLLDQHIENVHDGVNPNETRDDVRCERCEETFGSEAARNGHLASCQVNKK